MEKDIIWNLLAEISQDGIVGNLIMPDDYGQLQEKNPIGKNWYLIRWPVNPHFTGETMIREILSKQFPNRTKV
jgi:hypothetical protein